MDMKKILIFAFLISVLFSFSSLTVFAEDSKTSTQLGNTDDKKIGVITERVKESTKNATPEQMQEKLERKGNDLWKTARSASVLSLGIYAVAFIGLLVLGIFWKKARGMAFGVLALGILGYLMINYLPDIIDFIKLRVSG
jgi:hypothetical protein